MFNFLKGVENKHFDLARILWFTGSIFMLGSGLYSMVINKEPFLANALTFGGGFAALLAAGGLGVKLKDTGVADAVSTSNG